MTLAFAAENDPAGLGWSLMLPEVARGNEVGRDIQWRRGSNGRDLAVTSGVDNLQQALAVALTTRLGDDVFTGAFGFAGLDALAEETNPVLARDRLRVAVIQTVQADPRVRRIVDVRVGDPAETPADALTVMRRSRELHILVVFETTGYRQETITMRMASDGR